MASSSGSSYTSSEETTNFARICRIVVDVLRDILWQVLIHEIPAADLPNRVRMNQKKLGSLDVKIKTWLCGISLSSSEIPIAEKFDLSSLYTLIRNLCGQVPTPSAQWGKPPPPGGTTLGDDIERVREFRNVLYGHAKQAKIDTADFNNLCINIQNVVSRFDAYFSSNCTAMKCDFKVAIDTVLTCSMDKSLQDTYVDKMKEIGILSDDMENVKQQFGSVEQQVDDLKQKVEDVEQKVGDVEQKVEDVEQQVGCVEQKVGDVEQKVGCLEQKVGDVEQKVGCVEQKVDDVEQQVGNVEQHIGSIEQQVVCVEQKVDNVEQQIGDVKQTFGDVEQQVGIVKRQISDFKQLVKEEVGDVKAHLKKEIEEIKETLKKKPEVVEKGKIFRDEKDKMEGVNDSLIDEGLASQLEEKNAGISKQRSQSTKKRKMNKRKKGDRILGFPKKQKLDKATKLKMASNEDETTTSFAQHSCPKRPKVDEVTESKMPNNADEIMSVLQQRISCTDPRLLCQILNKTVQVASSSISTLEENCLTAGMKFHGVTPRNGNCFFEAVSSQLQRLNCTVQMSAQQLRKDVVAFMKTNRILDTVFTVI